MNMRDAGEASSFNLPVRYVAKYSKEGTTQLVKEVNALVVADTSNNKVLNTWTTGPASNPHGMDIAT